MTSVASVYSVGVGGAVAVAVGGRFDDSNMEFDLAGIKESGPVPQLQRSSSSPAAAAAGTEETYSAALKTVFIERISSSAQSEAVTVPPMLSRCNSAADLTESQESSAAPTPSHHSSVSNPHAMNVGTGFIDFQSPPNAKPSAPLVAALPEQSPLHSIFTLTRKFAIETPDSATDKHNETESEASTPSSVNSSASDMSALISSSEESSPTSVSFNQRLREALAEDPSTAAEPVVHTISIGTDGAESESEDEDSSDAEDDAINNAVDFGSFSKSSKASRKPRHRKKRRAVTDIDSHELWKCSFRPCDKIYKRTSSVSIHKHRETCEHRPISLTAFNQFAAATGLNGSNLNPMATMMGMNYGMGLGDMSGMAALGLGMGGMGGLGGLGGMGLGMGLGLGMGGLNMGLLNNPFAAAMGFGGLSPFGLNGMESLMAMNGLDAGKKSPPLELLEKESESAADYVTPKVNSRKRSLREKEEKPAATAAVTVPALTVARTVSSVPSSSNESTPKSQKAAPVTVTAPATMATVASTVSTADNAKAMSMAFNPMYSTFAGANMNPMAPHMVGGSFADMINSQQQTSAALQQEQHMSDYMAEASYHQTQQQGYYPMPVRSTVPPLPAPYMMSAEELDYSGQMSRLKNDANMMPQSYPSMNQFQAQNVGMNPMNPMNPMQFSFPSQPRPFPYMM